ncbi:MAG TPA: hypothetical protein VFG68_13140 [Fimbriiglobus sp.]|nr:hypothetical protein [Fimbriiglobus sp.]
MTTVSENDMDSLLSFRLSMADHDRLDKLALRLSWERQERVRAGELLREGLEQVFARYYGERRG